MGVVIIGVVLVIALIGALPALYWLYPKLLLHLYRRYGYLLVTGVKRKFVKTKSGFTFCYYERKPTITASTSTPPTLVFLHGFTASKTMWLQTAKLLPKEWGVVIPDLPGHGESSFKTKADYSPRSFAEKINDFVEALGLKEFHLIGLSMGALLSATYVTIYPHKLKSLTLMCMPRLENLPGGEKARLLKEMEESKSDTLLLPQNESQFKYMLENFTYNYNPQILNSGMRKAYVDSQIPHYPAFREIVKELKPGCDPKALAEDLSKITMPVFIVWGENDELCHPAGAKVLSSIFKESKVLMIERCGHLITIERPRKSAYALINFIKQSV